MTQRKLEYLTQMCTQRVMTQRKLIIPHAMNCITRTRSLLNFVSIPYNFCHPVAVSLSECQDGYHIYLCVTGGGVRRLVFIFISLDWINKRMKKERTRVRVYLEIMQHEFARVQSFFKKEKLQKRMSCPHFLFLFNLARPPNQPHSK